MRESLDFSAENELIRSLATGNNVAFRQVYKQSYKIVVGTLVKMGADEQDAEDVYQQCMLVLYNKCKENNFSLDCKIPTFMTSVAKNIWFKQLDKEKRKNKNESGYAQLLEIEDSSLLLDFNKIQHNEERVRQLNEALEKLGTGCKEILLAYYIDKKSMQDIAETFNYTNAQNAKTQKHKCLNRLKKIFFKENTDT